MKEYKLFIDGEFVESDSKEFIEVENPLTQEVIAFVPRANASDVDKACARAKYAFSSFQDVPIGQRIEYIVKFREYLINNKEEIVQIISEELGSPREFTEKNQVENNIDRIDAFIAIAKEYQYEKKLDGLIIRKEPVGVVGCITPWNYPLGQIIQKVIPAIINGNTVVLKPSKQTPLSAYFLIRGFIDAGLPKGVLNLVTGIGAEVGDAIAKNPNVDMISFTGSTKGGKELGQLALKGLKKVTLECGGKSPAIFIDQLKISIGVRKALNSILFNTGQTCSALSRVIVLPETRNRVIEEIKAQLSNYQVGDPNLDTTTMGPLSSRKQFDKVKQFIEMGFSEVDVITGLIPFDEKGYFIEPVVFDNVPVDSPLFQEEIFGPVLVITNANDLQDAINIANSVEYGLSAAVFGDEGSAIEVARHIRSGQVIINDSIGNIFAPFGGYKQSGIGREGGIEGFEAYLETKSILI